MIHWAFKTTSTVSSPKLGERRECAAGVVRGEVPVTCQKKTGDGREQEGNERDVEYY